jgi:hypothetical protein
MRGPEIAERDAKRQRQDEKAEAGDHAAAQRCQGIAPPHEHRPHAGEADGRHLQQQPVVARQREEQRIGAHQAQGAVEPCRQRRPQRDRGERR